MRPSPPVAAENDAGPADRELVRRAVSLRDGAAFEALIGRYHSRVFRVIMRLVKHSERAQDLTQETFLRAWRALPSYGGEAGFFTWIYRIARNTVTSDWRRTRSRPKVTQSLDEPAGDGRRVDAHCLADTSAEPARIASQRERQSVLQEAIDSLTADFREIIVLRDIEDCSYEDIATMLEVPVGTVRSRLHRARLELRSRIGKAFDD
jgi:RNA polymerase sigma-70 factor (ECF subfamily)